MQLYALWDPMDEEAMNSNLLDTPGPAAPGPIGNDKLLVLSRALQTTLNLGRLLELFSMECRGVADFDSLRFRSDRDNVNLLIGTESTHTCTYRMTLGGELLGELTFTRATRFTEADTRLLEFLCSHLLCPLRNALLYRKALLVAARDPLTGTYNRATLEQSLHREVSLAKRHGNPFSVIMLDLDHFKRVNDEHGHIMGDCVLKQAAKLFQARVRESDTVFRFGGEEFAILLSNSDLEGARRLAERIRTAMEDLAITCEGHTLSLTLSAGVAQWSDDEAPDRVLARADHALYAAKRRGRNTVVAD